MSIDGMARRKVDGLVIYQWNVFQDREVPIVAALTTRTGGVSRNHLSSLNIGHAVMDEPENLEENQRRLTRALNIEACSWSVADQVHGCSVAKVSGRDTLPHTRTDALELDSCGVIAAVMLADCHPVLIYDPVRHSGMICHAGWRGSCAGIVDVAVRRMVNAGSQISRLLAATGPGIGPCCYQVGEEVVEAFRRDFNYPDRVFRPHPDGGRALNLEEANMARLRHAGLKENNIGRGGFCTACRPDEFFSYRKERGLTGRHVALMALL